MLKRKQNIIAMVMGRVVLLFFIIIALGACAKSEDMPTVGDSGDTGDTADTGDSSDTGDTADSSAVDESIDELEVSDEDATGGADDAACTDENFKENDDDGDGIANYLDGCSDFDDDGTPNYLDIDSDGDGISDHVECGEDFNHPRNSDTDNMPDFLDVDSDNDGVLDRLEEIYGTDVLKKDSDDDGSDDLAEVVYGSDPLDATDSIPDGIFYVVLPYDAPESVSRSLTFNVKIDAIDVAILLDISESMTEELEELKKTIKTDIVDAISQKYRGETEYAGFSLATFGWQHPYSLRQRITASNTKIQHAIDAVEIPKDTDELHDFALFALASGQGVENVVHRCLPGFEGCAQTIREDSTLSLAQMDCSASWGDVGGGCFRRTSMPIIIMITDESFMHCIQHDDVPDGYNTLCRYDQPNGPGQQEAIAVMSGIGAKFIGIDTGFSEGKPTNAAFEDFKTIAEQTGSLDGDGKPFIYHAGKESGEGLASEIVSAIDNLTEYIKMDVKTESRSEEMCGGLSVSKFVREGAPIKAIPGDAVQSVDETTFYGVKKGSSLIFEMKFYNDFCINKSDEPLTYKAFVTVLGNGSFLNSHLVTVIVPPEK
ncbi:hypothetical protein KAH37_04435 [bacterium]|nr:hypothetical protein [bacterium]